MAAVARFGQAAEGGGARRVVGPLGARAPGSCSLPARPASPERRLTASCSVPALPWSACCPVAPRRNSWVAPQRFISDGVATYPCEPVTRVGGPMGLERPNIEHFGRVSSPAESASPLRDSPLVLPLPSATAPAGAPPLRRVATPLASVRCPVQRHYRQLWIGPGSWHVPVESGGPGLPGALWRGRW